MSIKKEGNERIISNTEEEHEGSGIFQSVFHNFKSSSDLAVYLLQK
jgi:hypothetical protein